MQSYMNICCHFNIYDFINNSNAKNYQAKTTKYIMNLHQIVTFDTNKWHASSMQVWIIINVQLQTKEIQIIRLQATK